MEATKTKGKGRDGLWLWVSLLALVLAVLALNVRLLAIKRENRQLKLEQLSSSRGDRGAALQERLYSLPLQSRPSGQTEWLHFTPYGSQEYLLVLLSAECSGCLRLLRDLEGGWEAIPPRVKPFLFQDGSLPLTTCLPQWRIAHEDSLQLADRVPALVWCNAQGRVLVRYQGWHPDLWALVIKHLQDGEQR